MRKIILFAGVAFIGFACQQNNPAPTPPTPTPPDAVNEFNGIHTTTTTYWGTPYVSKVTITGASTRTFEVIQTIDGDVDTITLTGAYNSTANTISINPCSNCGVGQRPVLSDGHAEFKNNKLYMIWHETGSMGGGSPITLTWEINEN